MITANTWFKINFETWKKGRLYKLAARFQVIIRSDPVGEEPLLAYVSEGAWIVHCPDCRGAEYAWEEGNFYCCSCQNSKVGHRIRQSKFPDNREEIEAILIERPLLNRNWRNKETVEDLKRENEEHAEELLPIANRWNLPKKEHADRLLPIARRWNAPIGGD